MDLYSFPFAFRGLTLNEHRTAAGGLDATKESETIRVDRFDFSRLQQRDQREPLNIVTGGDLGDASATFRYLSIAGMIKAKTGLTLSDKIAALLQAFNVEEAISEYPTDAGTSPLSFTDVTSLSTVHGTAYTDPTLGTAGFYVPERFFARPAAFPIITQRRSGGDSAGFACELVCADPRRYLATAESVVLNSGNSFSASCPNWNNAIGWAAPFVATIVLTGAGHASFTFDVANDGAGPLILNLSGLTASTVTFDSKTGVIKVNGVERADLRTSAGGTLIARIPRGGATATATNTTNVSSVTLAYSQARG